MQKKSCVLIGYGRMGSAFITQFYKDFEFTVVSPNSKPPFECKQVKSVKQLDSCYDVIILGVKPYMIHQILKELDPKTYNKDTIIISLAAGLTVDSMKSTIGSDVQICVVMCNLAVREGKGILAIYPPNKMDFLDKCGMCIYVNEEEDIDKFCAIVGSGSGFCFSILDMYAKAALSMKVSVDVNMEEVVARLFEGSLEAYRAQKKSFNDMKDDVITPKGPTDAGLNNLCNAYPIIQNALNSSQNRAQEIGRNKDNK